MWRRGVVVITIAQLHSTKPELRFCAGSRDMSEIRDGEDLWQWSQLEIRLNTFRRSTISQKQFIIIIIITHIKPYYSHLEKQISSQNQDTGTLWHLFKVNNKRPKLTSRAWFSWLIQVVLTTLSIIFVWIFTGKVRKL